MVTELNELKTTDLRITKKGYYLMYYLLYKVLIDHHSLNMS